ncbi:hypothetical protein KDJ21_020505 [Metabacillus litoralis]|uniref:hypothetical protein n=1 Tax=Metabacillus TaxID=2675233 RepID=UPI001BA0B77A|nr:hypothetical protein [Metabacillus litoralis]UHA59163.1 hypothetical protein KDJ21_020505 [Metabacillus litoralis]
MIHLYNADNFHTIDWFSKRNGQFLKTYFEPLIKYEIPYFIENVHSKIYLLEVGDLLLPVSVTDQQYKDSYVASPYTHYISYAKEELWELKNKALEELLRPVIGMMGQLLRKSNMNKVVIVNNWLLSTNLFESTLSFNQVQRITDFLAREFPKHTILFRSITKNLHENMMKSFDTVGYKRIMSRSIYLFNPEQKLTKQQLKNLYQDEKLIKKHQYKIRDVSIEDCDLILRLYLELYIQKYSTNNPQFTSEFIRHAYKSKLLTFKVVCKGDQIVGAIGFFIQGKVLTTPILGYSIKLEKNAGLYRVLSFLITKEIMNNHYIGHRSAGAGEFKRKRGSIQQIEYTYFYQKHLPMTQRWGWNLLKIIMDLVVEPLAKKKQF